MRVERVEFPNYGLHLKDKSQLPSRSGNTRARYQYIITISDERYSFLGTWSGKFV